MRDSKGIGLIEVVIGTAIMAVVVLAISSMLVDQMKGAQSVQKRLDAGQLGSFINTILSTSSVCSASGLVGQPAPAAKLPTTADTVSVPTLNYAGLKFDDAGGANSLFDNGEVKILNLKYHAVSINANIYSVVIRLQVSAQGSNAATNVVGGNTLAPVDFPVVFTVVGGIIKSCGASCDTYTITSTSAGFHNNTTYSGSTGYSISCSGLITQWGITNSSPSDNTFININFPIPFPNNCYTVTGAEVTDRVGFAIGCASTSQFFLRTSNHDTMVDWIAYGN